MLADVAYAVPAAAVVAETVVDVFDVDIAAGAVDYCLPLLDNLIHSRVELQTEQDLVGLVHAGEWIQSWPGSCTGLYVQHRSLVVVVADEVLAVAALCPVVEAVVVVARVFVVPVPAAVVRVPGASVSGLARYFGGVVVPQNAGSWKV